MRLKQLQKNTLVAFCLFVLIIGNANGQCYSANAGSDISICGSGSALIGTSAVGGYTYSWWPTTGLSNPNIAQPTANPNSTNMYTLTMTPTGSNMLTNGGFESLDLTGFSTDYESSDYGAPPEGLAGVIDAIASISGYVFPHNGDYLFEGYAPDFSVYPLPTQRALYKTITINTNSNYTFSGWISNTITTQPVEFEMRLVGNNTGTTSQTFTTSSTCGVWTQFNMNWNSGSNTQVTLEIQCITDLAQFAIDDLSFNCGQTTDYMTFSRSTAVPSISPAGPITYYNHYENTTWIELSASASGAYQWYKNNVLIPGATSNNYYIQQSGLGNTTDYYKCVNACGTSNVVTVNYIGCTTNNGYPVSVPTGACMSALTGGNYLSLPTYSLGTGTSYSWSIDPATCLSINGSGQLTASGCQGNDDVGIISTSSRGTERLYMFYYFTANNSCRMAASGGNNGPTKEPVPPRWNEHLTYITPNPAKYAVTIRSKEALNRIEFYNAAGVLVKTYAGNRQSLITIGISDLKPGLYMVRLVGASGPETKKLVVQ